MHLGPKRSATGSLYCMEADHSPSEEVRPGHGLQRPRLDARRQDHALHRLAAEKRDRIRFRRCDSGAITNERVAFDSSHFAGVPDGMAIDAEDRLWIAFCHGSHVRCFDSRTWNCEAEIAFPCREVTACAFGGPD